MKKILCPYCGAIAELRDSAIVYNGRSYGLIYLCSNWPTCDAYVGVHKGTSKPLGRLANAELREWKNRAHRAFDVLWKTKRFTRSQAYHLASDILGKPFSETHIGMFDVQDCKDLVAALSKLPDRKRQLL